jgi:hypothetical protein
MIGLWFTEMALSDEMKVQFNQRKQPLDTARANESPLQIKDQSVDSNAAAVADSRPKSGHRVPSRREAIDRRSISESAPSDAESPGKDAPSEKEVPGKELTGQDGKPEDKAQSVQDAQKQQLVILHVL